MEKLQEEGTALAMTQKQRNFPEGIWGRGWRGQAERHLTEWLFWVSGWSGSSCSNPGKKDDLGEVRSKVRRRGRCGKNLPGDRWLGLMQVAP